MNDYRNNTINSTRAAAKTCTSARKATSTPPQGRPQGHAPTIYDLVHSFSIIVLFMREHLRFLTFMLRFAQPTSIIEDDARSCIVGTGLAPVLAPLLPWGGALPFFRSCVPPIPIICICPHYYKYWSNLWTTARWYETQCTSGGSKRNIANGAGRECTRSYKYND